MIIKEKIRVIFILICSLTFWFIPLSFAHTYLDKRAEDLCKKIEAYFFDYYKMIKEGKYPSVPQTLDEIKIIFSESRLFNEKEKERIAAKKDFFNLTLLLNELLKKYDLYINIFLNPQTATIDCWLAQKGEKEELSLTVWGKKLSFFVMSFDDLLVHGYSYYYSPKREDIQFLSFKDTIFLNREEIKKKARERWQLLLSRYRKKSSYNPYRSERLRRDLLVSAWQDLFLISMRENSLDRAKTIFITKAVEKFKKIGLYHEAGHRLADERYLGEDDAKSEIIALLSEMYFGSLPKESLNTLLAFAWRSQWPVYRYSGQTIIRDFLQLIEKGAISQELTKRLLIIKGNSLLKKEDIFHYLSDDDIMKLSEEEWRRVISN